MDKPMGAPREVADGVRLIGAAVLAGLTFQLTNCGDALGTPEISNTDAAAVPVDGAPVLAEAVAARYVKLESVSELDGQPWAAMSELTLLDRSGAVLPRQGWKASADSAAQHAAAPNAIDGDPNSIWHTEWEGASPPHPHQFVVDLGRVARLSGFRYLPRQDLVRNGNIARYRFYVSLDALQWGSPVAEGDLSMQGTAATEKTVLFALQAGNRAPIVAAPAERAVPFGEMVSLRIDARDPDDDPLTFSAQGLPAGLAIDPARGVVTGTPIVPGRSVARVTAADGKGASSSVEIEWTVAAPRPLPADPLGAPGGTRFVKLEQLSEVQGRDWGSVAELTLFDAEGRSLPRDGWTASADSAEPADPPANAIDGSARSIWHTRWRYDAHPPPHVLIVDLHARAQVAGFRVLPRQDGVANGAVSRYRFYLSADGIDWGAPVAEGELAGAAAPAREATVWFACADPRRAPAAACLVAARR